MTQWIIAFRGELLDGFDRTAVMDAFMAQFGNENIAGIFSGREVELVRSADSAEMSARLGIYKRLGMNVYLKDEKEAIPAAPKTYQSVLPASAGFKDANTEYLKPRDNNDDLVHQMPGALSFTLDGRYNRTNFFMVFAILTLFILVLDLIRAAIGGGLLFIIAYLVILILQLRACALRFHDLNLTGAFALACLIPLSHIPLFFIPGSKTANRYGYPTERVGTNGIIFSVAVFILDIIVFIISYNSP
jgi:uncharacterized membrane protein YhaH (DUF805 family)